MYGYAGVGVFCIFFYPRESIRNDSSSGKFFAKSYRYDMHISRYVHCALLNTYIHYVNSSRICENVVISCNITRHCVLKLF